ncbi:hypothetical protein LSCM1_05038 [Leishmania martiniquensis]|uniref:Uncharacterized protein n=1 Tax=Leishmania martiniquensis TaxID=1580590 RepID=A0A836KP72_9TRYP|nr:hypothetical protein LSCM1_05038 [Leishmania martiniquensis]
MFGFGGFGGSASGGAPPLISAPGRGGGVLGAPTNAVFSAAGGPAPMSGLSNPSSGPSALHKAGDARLGSFSRFGGSHHNAPSLVFGGAASIKIGDGGSNITSHGGNFNMSGSQRGLRPKSEAALPLSNIPTFGTGATLPSPSLGAYTIPADLAVATVPSPSYAAITSTAAPVFAAPAFSAVLPLPSMPASGDGGIPGGGGSGSGVLSSGNVFFTAPQKGQEGNGSGHKRARALAAAAPVLASAETQSTPGARDAGGSVLGSAFTAFGTTGTGGSVASGPTPLPLMSSVFGAPVPSVDRSAAALSTLATTFSSPAAAPAHAAAATEPISLTSVSVPPPSAFGASVLGSASAAAVAAPRPPPAAAAAKTSATGAKKSSSAFSAPPSKIQAPIASAFTAALPEAPGSAPPASMSEERAVPHSGSIESTSSHVSPFARAVLSAGATPAPSTTASAFSPAASGLGPAGGGGAGRGGSVFTAAAATPARSAASFFGASAASGKAPPSPAPSKALDTGAHGGAATGRRRGRSAPRSNAGEGSGSGSGGSARPCPSSLDPTASPPVRGSRLEIPAPRHGQRRPVSLPPHKQKPPTALALLDKLPIPPLPTDEKRLCIAARLCKSFLIQLASDETSGGHGRGDAPSSRDEGIVKTLEHAFFGVVGIEGVYGDFGKTASEMLALWEGHVRPMVSDCGTRDADRGRLSFPGEMWIALFALGTYLNTILSTLQCGKTGGHAALSSAPVSVTDLAAYKAGLRAHPVEALTDACHYANELSELLQALFQRGGEADAPPYSVIPVVLRRVRSVFDEATARGVATVQSNLNTVTSKLFGVLNRRVKASAVQQLSEPCGPPRWLLTYDSKESECLLHSFAYLIMEMIAADAPMSDDVDLFISAFHECFPSALAERCMLYYRRACALLRQPLCMSLVEEAASLLAKATVVYPPDAPLHNKRVLQVKLLAAEVALGRLPPDEDWLALEVPQLVDVVNALKTSRLDLLDAALAMHGPFFVSIGVHNVLCVARQRLALLMVVKFYLTHGCESRLCVSEMVRYHRLPYSAADAGVVWLLPLLVEKQMNGVLDHDYLILSAKTPFDNYVRESLAAAAATA